MIARKIKPEEVKRTEELFSVSFDYSYNNETSPLELYSQYLSDPQSRGQEHCLERFAAFEDNDTTMMSCFCMHPYSIRFDGKCESMFSIGGVATLPQYRKRGGIRACFENALPYLYERGAAFSYLYPFSTAYYRKFGYEMCCKRQFYRIALPHIPVFPLAGSCYLLESSTAPLASKDIPLVYSAWQEKYNMMVEGIPYDFSFIGSADPFKDQVFTYVYRSADNKPLAYMTFRNNTDPECRQLECSRFFYINAEGLQGLLTLAKSFASDYRYINFSLPTDLALEQILPEWSMGAVSCQLFPHGMVRVINVQKVLQDAAYKGSGMLTLQITDNHIAENNQTFRLIFSDSRCEEIIPTNENADISLSISTFSALIAGGYDTNAISLFPDVTIHNNTENISKVFYKKPVYITTSF